MYVKILICVCNYIGSGSQSNIISDSIVLNTEITIIITSKSITLRSLVIENLKYSKMNKMK